MSGPAFVSELVPLRMPANMTASECRGIFATVRLSNAAPGMRPVAREFLNATDSRVG